MLVIRRYKLGLYVYLALLLGETVFVNVRVRRVIGIGRDSTEGRLLKVVGVLEGTVNEQSVWAHSGRMFM